MVLYDITGKSIATYPLQEGNSNELKINQTQLTNGIYFYSITINGIVKEYSKFIIIK
jgi:Secretion system C-terminal sorting domain